MSFKKQIEKFLKGVQGGLIADQKAKDIKASGKSADSLTISADDFEGVLTGSAYFEEQIYGSPPGTVVSWLALKKWLDEKDWSKGLDESAKRGIAGAIKIKIEDRGTLRGNDPAFPGLDFAGILKTEQPKFVVEVRGEQVKLISDIFQSMKKQNP